MGGWGKIASPSLCIGYFAHPIGRKGFVLAGDEYVTPVREKIESPGVACKRECVIIAKERVSCVIL